MALAHSPSIVTSGLVLCLDAANPKSYPGTGSTWFDLSGNNRNFNLSNITYSSSNNGVLNFNGTTSYAQLTDSTFLNGLTGVTLEMVVKAAAVQTNDLNGLFTSVTPNNSDVSLTLRHDYIGVSGGKTNVYKFTVTNGVSTTINSESSEQSLSSNWVHLALVWSQTKNSGRHDFYINGIMNTISYQQYWTQPLGGATTAYIGIGSKNIVGTSSFNGNISVTRIYNRDLSADEIKQNFNALRGRFDL